MDAAPLPIVAGLSAPSGTAAAAPDAAPRASAPEPAPAAPHAYPAPAAQVGPAIVTLAPAVQPGAPQRLTIRLDPDALGKVEVRIERSAHGATTVELSAERPDTLQTLIADRPTLNAALDLAGIPPEGRTVQFSLAPSDAGAGGSAAGGGMAAGGGTSGGSGGGSGFGGASSGGDGGDARTPPAPRRAARLNAGIDITA